ncbi:hypothetical protein DPMN_192068 [Dreissena polymorpha]|uniref:Uncharacterized protein n=1 Tax=Dreissena polymorpha TaxID=45954 RepID=A0A9D4BCV5_DREPO|nr:hypothetical protein DPMN_192068 [Dreissena polymorpha]
MLKLAQTDRPTDRPTDRAKTICPPLLYILKIVPEPTMTNRALICPVFDRHIKETNGKDEKNNTAITEIGSSPNIGKLSGIQWVLMLLKKIHNHIRIFHHGDWTINATESEKAPPLGGHVFHEIIGTLYRVFKRFFESRAIAPTLNLTRRTERLSALSKHRRSDCPPCQNIVGATERPSALSNLARDCPDTRKNAPPPGAHVFEPTGTIFELAQDIILTNLLTKFHDDGQ